MADNDVQGIFEGFATVYRQSLCKTVSFFWWFKGQIFIQELVKSAISEMWLKSYTICLLFIGNQHISKAEDPLEDVQTEFYLPYSISEDVDFSLSKPGGFGCYQW